MLPSRSGRPMVLAKRSNLAERILKSGDWVSCQMDGGSPPDPTTARAGCGIWKPVAHYFLFSGLCFRFRPIPIDDKWLRFRAALHGCSTQILGNKSENSKDTQKVFIRSRFPMMGSVLSQSPSIIWRSFGTQPTERNCTGSRDTPLP